MYYVRVDGVCTMEMSDIWSGYEVPTKNTSTHSIHTLSLFLSPFHPEKHPTSSKMRAMPRNTFKYSTVPLVLVALLFGAGGWVPCYSPYAYAYTSYYNTVLLYYKRRRRVRNRNVLKYEISIRR